MKIAITAIYSNPLSLTIIGFNGLLLLTTASLLGSKIVHNAIEKQQKTTQFLELARTREMRSTVNP